MVKLGLSAPWKSFHMALPSGCGHGRIAVGAFEMTVGKAHKNLPLSHVNTFPLNGREDLLDGGLLEGVGH